jgi:hypothetical protein
VLYCTYSLLQGQEVAHTGLISFFIMFVLSRGDDEEDDFFVDDQDINRLIIVTQV